MKSQKINQFVVDNYDNNSNKSFVAGKTYIRPSGKVFDHKEVSNIIESAFDGWFTSGRFNKEFETKLSGFLGIKHLLTTNSGSSSNLLAFSALTSDMHGERALKKGDEVISVAAGFPTTVNPIIQNGCIPVFVDICLKTLNIDVNLIEQSITENTKAIFLAHTLGNPFNLHKIIEICRKYNLWLIEDNCDALGSKYNGQYTGTFGNVGTLSFYPAHHITMGEGGAIFTNDSTLKKVIESFRDWGRDCYCEPGMDNTCKKRFEWQLGDLPFGYDHKYTYSHMGYNLKITDMQAALGLAQLEKLDSFISARKHNFHLLRERLKIAEEFLFIAEPTDNSAPSWFGFPITLRDEAPFNRVDLLAYLEQNKIGSRLIFAGNLTKQPYMKKIKYRIASELKNTDIVMNNSFWIGLYPGINEEMIDYMADKILTFLGLKF
jgi:CDP-4-dehydro-6-deoxyglucose reductase, E1